MKALYAGSFDPITFGHIDIIKRGASLFDQLYVLVTTSLNKKSFFEQGKRISLIAPHLPENAMLISDSDSVKLTVEVAKDYECDVLLRGVRTVTDWEYEYAMALANKSYGVETLFLPASTEVAFVSSTLIKEAWSFRGDVSQWVPKNVLEAFEKHRKECQKLLDNIKEMAKSPWAEEVSYVPCDYESKNGYCKHKDVPQPMPCHQQNCPWEERAKNEGWWKNHPGRWKG